MTLITLIAIIKSINRERGEEMKAEDIVARETVTITLKTMWVKYIQENETKEIIIPQRLSQKELDVKYFKDAKILDHRIATQLITIPYSALLTDGKIDTKIHETKYSN